MNWLCVKSNSAALACATRCCRSPEWWRVVPGERRARQPRVQRVGDACAAPARATERSSTRAGPVQRPDRHVDAEDARRSSRRPPADRARAAALDGVDRLRRHPRQRQLDRLRAAEQHVDASIVSRAPRHSARCCGTGCETDGTGAAASDGFMEADAKRGGRFGHRAARRPHQGCRRGTRAITVGLQRDAIGPVDIPRRQCARNAPDSMGRCAASSIVGSASPTLRLAGAGTLRARGGARDVVGASRRTPSAPDDARALSCGARRTRRASPRPRARSRRPAAASRAAPRPRCRCRAPCWRSRTAATGRAARAARTARPRRCGA